jgi:single-strand DNA-binding protein
MDLNKAMVIGRVTQTPEKRVIPSGQSVASFSVATNRTWVKDGQKQEQAEFHNVVAWGKLADICEQYLDKGRRVYIEGRIQTRSWDGQDGSKKYRTEIIAENMIMLDGRNSNSGGGNTGSSPQVADDEIRIEDIPF